MMNIIRFFLSYGNSHLIQKKSGLFLAGVVAIFEVSCRLHFGTGRSWKRDQWLGPSTWIFVHETFWSQLSRWCSRCKIFIVTMFMLIIIIMIVIIITIIIKYTRLQLRFCELLNLHNKLYPSSPHSATLTNQSQYVRFHVNHDQIELEFLGGSSTQSMNISSLHVEFPGVLWNITIHDSHGGIDPTEMFVNFYLSPVSFSLKKGSSRWTRSISSRWLR